MSPLNSGTPNNKQLVFDAIACLEDEAASYDARCAAMQTLIDIGTAWRLSGSVGREAMTMMHLGYVTQGTSDHVDAYGNHVPSRHQVAANTLGSVGYARAARALVDLAERAENRDEAMQALRPFLSCPERTYAAQQLLDLFERETVTMRSWQAS